jgi:hypothetical protein
MPASQAARPRRQCEQQRATEPEKFKSKFYELLKGRVPTAAALMTQAHGVSRWDETIRCE